MQPKKGKQREQSVLRKPEQWKSKNYDVFMERKNGTVYEKVGLIQNFFRYLIFSTEKFYWESIDYVW